MLLALAYSKCSKLSWLHVCAISISSLLSLLHTSPHEPLGKIIMSGMGMQGEWENMYLRRSENVILRVTQLFHSHITQIVYASAAGINTLICSLLVRLRGLGYMAGFLILYHSQPLSAFAFRGIIGPAPGFKNHGSHFWQPQMPFALYTTPR